MSFGEKLMKLRKQKGMSQEELAQELNVSRQAVSKWESNNSYPETDKIVQICKLFNVSMDELIGLKDTNKTSDNKSSFINNITKYFDLFISGIKLFYSMTWKQKIKCLIEMCFYALILFGIGALIIMVLSEILSELLSILPWGIISYLLDIFNGLLTLLFLIIGIYILLKLYNIRYLNCYLNMQSKDIDDEKVEVKNNESININTEKIIIRDAKDNFNPFICLKNTFKIIVKLFFIFCAFSISLLFITLMAFLIFVLFYITKGAILVYTAVTLIGSLLLIYIFLEIFIKFIFDSPLKVKKILIIFISSLVIIGSGIGLFIRELSTYSTYSIDSIENNNLVKEENIVMQDNLVMDYLNYVNTKIIIEDRDDIKVEFYANNDLINIGPYTYTSNYEIHSYYVSFSSKKLNEYIDIILDWIENKKILLNGNDVKIVIHINEDNLNKIRDNYRAMLLEE